MRETIQNTNGKQFHAVSLSGGKDSTAMLLLMIERDMPIDMVLSADTGMEFPEMYEHLAKLDEHLFRERGIHITLALDELSEEAASIPAADVCMEQAHDRVAEIRRSTQKVTQIRKHLTDTQFRRMWMYFVDGMTIDEIGKVEGVSHQAISLNITAAIRKIKKYF